MVLHLALSSLAQMINSHCAATCSPAGMRGAQTSITMSRRARLRQTRPLWLDPLAGLAMSETPNTSAQALRFCLKLLEKLRYRVGVHKAFEDLVCMSALAISNSVDRTNFQERESQYMAISRGYEKEDLLALQQCLGCVVAGLEFEHHDFLGKLYMEMELGKKSAGQFFTPYTVCKAMAEITVHDVKARIDEKGFITVWEPCSGSGAMVIAVAESLMDSGYSHRSNMHVVCQDIDITAVQMTYVQLSLLGIPAVVLHGNSLFGEIKSTWFTPGHVLGRWSDRLAANEHLKNGRAF